MSGLVKSNNPCSVILESVSSNLCVQVDASYCKNSLSTGYAAICRYNDGKWIFGIAGKTIATEALCLETMAIFHAIKWCKENKWKDITVLSCCQRAVRGVNNENSPTDKISNIYTMCREYLGKIEGGSLKSVPRSRVKDANYVARAARNRGEMYFTNVVIAPPPDIYGDLCNTNGVAFNFPATVFTGNLNEANNEPVCNFIT